MLTVSLNGSSTAATSQYNPGGVLPEVSHQSWILFGGLLVGLLALLIIPLVFSRVWQTVGGGHKKGRVKFNGAPAPLKGRVKIK